MGGDRVDAVGTGDAIAIVGGRFPVVDDIVAVGVIGLIYGQRNNLEGGAFAEGAKSPVGAGRRIMRG